MRLSTLFLCLVCVACSDGDSDNSNDYLRVPDGGARDDESQALQVELLVLNPRTASGYSGVTVRTELGESVTDESGRALASVMSGRYEIRLEAPGAITHRVYGHAVTDFSQVTYLSPNQITGIVFQQVGVSRDSQRGILVVGLDTPTLAPAVGATAAVDAESDAPFVFVGNAVRAGSEIVTGAQGFVTFPNVEPGVVTIDATLQGGACRIFPSEGDANTVPVTADEVSVVAFTCRPAE